MSLTKVSYSMVNGAVANVLDYGAVGDGITDCTNAVKSAAKTGKALFFPAGVYVVSSTIDYNQMFATDEAVIYNIHWFGESNYPRDGIPGVVKPSTGVPPSTILFTGTGTLLRCGLTATPPNNYPPAIYLHDLFFKGNNTVRSLGTLNLDGYVTTNAAYPTISESTQICIETEGQTEAVSVIERCRFYYWNKAIVLGDYTYNFEIRNNYISGNIGLHFANGYNTTTNVFSNEFANCSAGVWLSNGPSNQNISIIENIFQANQVAILNTSTINGLYVKRNYIQANPGFVHYGVDGTQSVLQNLEYAENFGADVRLGDLVDSANIYRNVLDDSVDSQGIQNSFTVSPIYIPFRSVREWENLNLASEAFNKFTGAQANNIIHHKQGARVDLLSLPGTVAVANGTGGTNLSLASVVRDDGAYWAVANPSRFTVNQTGNYVVSCTLVWAANATGVRGLSVTRNTGLIDYIEVPASSVGVTVVKTSFTQYLEKGDYINFVVFQTSGGSLDLVWDSTKKTYATIQLV